MDLLTKRGFAAAKAEIKAARSRAELSARLGLLREEAADLMALTRGPAAAEDLRAVLLGREKGTLGALSYEALRRATLIREWLLELVDGSPSRWSEVAQNRRERRVGALLLQVNGSPAGICWSIFEIRDAGGEVPIPDPGVDFLVELGLAWRSAEMAAEARARKIAREILGALEPARVERDHLGRRLILSPQGEPVVEDGA